MVFELREADYIWLVTIDLIETYFIPVGALAFEKKGFCCCWLLLSRFRHPNEEF